MPDNTSKNPLPKCLLKAVSLKPEWSYSHMPLPVYADKVEATCLPEDIDVDAINYNIAVYIKDNLPEHLNDNMGCGAEIDENGLAYVLILEKAILADDLTRTLEWAVNKELRKMGIIPGYCMGVDTNVEPPEYAEQQQRPTPRSGNGPEIA